MQKIQRAKWMICRVELHCYVFYTRISSCVGMAVWCSSVVVVLVWRRTAHYHQSSEHQNIRFPSCPKIHSCLGSFLVLPVISYIIPDPVTWYLFTWNSIVRCISAALPVLWIQWQHNVIAVCFGSSYQFGICSKMSESFAKCPWLTMLDKAYSQYSCSPFIYPRALSVYRGASVPHVHHSSDIHALNLLWLAREGLQGGAEAFTRYSTFRHWG